MLNACVGLVRTERASGENFDGCRVVAAGVLRIVLRRSRVGVVGLPQVDGHDFLRLADRSDPPLRVETVVQAVGIARRVSDDRIAGVGLDDPVVVVDRGRPLDVHERLDRVLEPLGVAVVGRVQDAGEDGADGVRTHCDVLPEQIVVADELDLARVAREVAAIVKRRAPRRGGVHREPLPPLEGIANLRVQVEPPKSGVHDFLGAPRLSFVSDVFTADGEVHRRVPVERPLAAVHRHTRRGAEQARIGRVRELLGAIERAVD